MNESLTDATIRILAEGLHRNSKKLNKQNESKNTNKVSDLVEVGDILTSGLNNKVMEYCTSIVGTREQVITNLNDEPKIITPELESAIKSIKGNKVVVYFIDMQEQSKLDNADTIILGLDNENRIVDKQLLTIENDTSIVNEAKSDKIQFDLNEDKRDNYWITGTATYNNNNYTISAKVFSDGSDYGIDNGPVSKLYIKDNTNNKVIINYDRGWDIKPTKQTNYIYEETLKAVTDFRNEHPYKQDSEVVEENVEPLTETKTVSEFESDIDLIIALESETIKISTEEELNRLKSICDKLKNSQGFYGRLLNQLEQIDISNLPVEI